MLRRNFSVDVSNPFKLWVHSEVFLMRCYGFTGLLKELAECKFHGTLMKTNSKFKE